MFGIEQLMQPARIQIKEEPCDLEEEEEDLDSETWDMDNDKRERFLCLLGIIRMERDHIFGDLKKLASDGTIVTSISKKLATEKVAKATYDLGFTRRILGYREWRQRFWGQWKKNAKRQKEKRLREGGAPLPWEAMILDICGIDRSEPGAQPTLIKWSAHLNGSGVHKADTSVTNQSVECDPREPSTSDGLSYEGLVQQLHQDEEERQCQLLGVPPSSREDRLATPPPETCFLGSPTVKRRRDDSPTPSLTYVNSPPAAPSEMLIRTQVLLNLLEAIPKADALGYNIDPHLLQGLLVKKD